MSENVTNLDKGVYGFDYISATIGDTSKPKEGTKTISKTQEIQLDDIEHFNGRLIHKMRGVFLFLCILSAILAIGLGVALTAVDVKYLNIILAAVFGVLAVVFLVLFCVKRKSYFKMEVYFGKYRDDILEVDYNDTIVNLGNRFPAKIEIYALLNKQDLALKHGQFVSKLGSLMAGEGSGTACPAIGYNSPAAPYSLAPYGMPYMPYGLSYGMSFGAPYGEPAEVETPVAHAIRINPAEKTVTLVDY